MVLRRDDCGRRRRCCWRGIREWFQGVDIHDHTIQPQIETKLPFPLNVPKHRWAWREPFHEHNYKWNLRLRLTHPHLEFQLNHHNHDNQLQWNGIAWRITDCRDPHDGDLFDRMNFHESKRRFHGLQLREVHQILHWLRVVGVRRKWIPQISRIIRGEEYAKHPELVPIHCIKFLHPFLGGRSDDRETWHHGLRGWHNSSVEFSLKTLIHLSSNNSRETFKGGIGPGHEKPGPMPPLDLEKFWYN